MQQENFARRGVVSMQHTNRQALEYWAAMIPLAEGTVHYKSRLVEGVKVGEGEGWGDAGEIPDVTGIAEQGWKGTPAGHVHLRQGKAAVPIGSCNELCGFV